jgi:hypothetical protein
MSGYDEDLDRLSQRERARMGGRDRKVRGPRVVVDNPGLKQLALRRAQKLRDRLGRRAAG